MRVLVTIPHFCRRTSDQPRTDGNTYGSESGDIEARRTQVERCLTALHQTFGLRQALAASNPTTANETLAVTLDVVLVTSHNQHLADEISRHLFIQVATEAEPRFLGFVCHEVMRENAANYDFFVYLEDDLEITDALFFSKYTWFNGLFGQSALLQPNRFEVAPNLAIMKMYVDGDTTQPEISAQFQDITVRPRLLGEAFGRSFLFQRVDNVHSGCFVLNAAQLGRVATSSKFGTPNADFFGPLESAATLPIMRMFEVYKPAQENAGFLELNHLGRRFLIAAEPAPAPAAVPAPVPASEPEVAEATIPAASA